MPQCLLLVERSMCLAWWVTARCRNIAVEDTAWQHPSCSVTVMSKYPPQIGEWWLDSQERTQMTIRVRVRVQRYLTLMLSIHRLFSSPLPSPAMQIGKTFLLKNCLALKRISRKLKTSSFFPLDISSYLWFRSECEICCVKFGSVVRIIIVLSAWQHGVNTYDSNSGLCVPWNSLLSIRQLFSKIMILSTIFKYPDK